MMDNITRNLNIVTILTKQNLKFFDLCFVKIVTMFKLLVILFIDFGFLKKSVTVFFHQ